MLGSWSLVFKLGSKYFVQINFCKYGLLRFHGSKYLVRLNGSNHLVRGSKSFTLALRALPLVVQHQTLSNIVTEVNILHHWKNASLRIEKYPSIVKKCEHRYSGLAGSRSEEAAGSASAPLRPSVSVPPSTSVARLMPLQRVTSTRPHKYICGNNSWPDLSVNKEPSKFWHWPGFWTLSGKSEYLIQTEDQISLKDSKTSCPLSMGG